MAKNESAFPNEFGYGMELRDWFAGQALAGIATLFSVAGGTSEDIAKANATVSYLMADAMLKAREQ